VQDLDNLFAEGDYSGTSGWGAVKATHAGPYLGCPATGNTIVTNGIDFWRRRDDKFIENWVFVDMIHLFRQFGIDLMERMRSRAFHTRD
jgi:predicted ester cyclase